MSLFFVNHGLPSAIVKKVLEHISSISHASAFTHSPAGQNKDRILLVVIFHHINHRKRNSTTRHILSFLPHLRSAHMPDTRLWKQSFYSELYHYHQFEQRKRFKGVLKTLQKSNISTESREKKYLRWLWQIWVHVSGLHIALCQWQKQHITLQITHSPTFLQNSLHFTQLPHQCPQNPPILELNGHPKKIAAAISGNLKWKE